MIAVATPIAVCNPVLTFSITPITSCNFPINSVLSLIFTLIDTILGSSHVISSGNCITSCNVSPTLFDINLINLLDCLFNSVTAFDGSCGIKSNGGVTGIYFSLTISFYKIFRTI